MSQYGRSFRGNLTIEAKNVSYTSIGNRLQYLEGKNRIISKQAINKKRKKYQWTAHFEIKYIAKHKLH